MKNSWLGRVVRTCTFRSRVYRDIAEDSSGTTQSTLTTFLAALLAINFFLYANGASSNAFLAFGIPLFWTGGLVLWAGLLYALFSNAGPRHVKYIGHLRVHGFSIVGLVIPILVLSLMILSTNQSRLVDTLWIPTLLTGAMWMFAMQIHALRELVEVSMAKAIGAILLGLVAIMLLGAVLFASLFRVY